ncbi:MAG TPA: hypothetical protein VEJ63_22605 [Planctomycetota bacterium]|nr:hypothetical protein [Planctomycetota bacterium]
MNDDTDVPAEEQPPSEPPKPVAVEEFAAVDFEGALHDRSKVEARDLSSQYTRLAREADERQDTTSLRVFALLSAVCGIQLKPDDRAEPWGPMASFGDQRTALPSDYKGEQSATFLAIMDRIDNPGLRARLADIAWTNDRKAAGRAGAVAVAAYRECADGLLSGKFKPYLRESRASFEALKNVQRAFAVAQATTKKDAKGRAKFSDELKATALALYSAAKDAREYVVFLHTAERALHYEVIDPVTVATDCEAIAGTDDKKYPMPIKSLWRMAAQLHRNAGNKEGEQRCLLEAVQQTLAMRKQVNSAGAEAHWVQQALLELRHVEGQEELEGQLTVELRRLQRASTKEMGSFTIPLEVDDVRASVEELFGGLPFSEAMRRFGLLARSPTVQELKKQALKQLEDHPLSGMMPVSHIDADGKSIAKSPGAETEGEQPDEWYRHQVLQNESIRRHRTVAGVIDPARLTMHARFQIEERHLEPIIYRSPFVPQSQAPIVVLGLARFFQGDFMSAAHLLIPQLEPCLRHILKVNGFDPVRQFDDSTEEDYDLNAMFGRMRPELERIFGVDLVYELDLLFVGRPGPSLRNELSHGGISAGICFHPNVIYGCWMIYHLSMAFLLKRWDELTPELDGMI